MVGELGAKALTPKEFLEKAKGDGRLPPSKAQARNLFREYVAIK